MSGFLNLEIDAIGLDFSDSVLKLTKFEKTRGTLNLVSLSDKIINNNVIYRGKLENEEVFVSAVKDLLNNVVGEKIKTRYATLTLSEEISFLKVIKMPKMRKKELIAAILYEAENHLPLPTDDLYLDFQIIPSVNEKFLVVLIVAIPRSILDPYILAIEKVNFTIVAVETIPFSIIRALLYEKNEEEPILIINIGKEKATFIIFSEESIRFTSTLQFSHEPDEENNNLNQLVVEIRKHLDYYSKNFRHNLGKMEKIRKIILCGDLTIEANLLKKISDEFKINVIEGNPSLKINKDLIFTPHRKLFYTASIGAGLRHFFVN